MRKIKDALLALFEAIAVGVACFSCRVSWRVLHSAARLRCPSLRLYWAQR